MTLTCFVCGNSVFPVRPSFGLWFRQGYCKLNRLAQFLDAILSHERILHSVPRKTNTPVGSVWPFQRIFKASRKVKARRVPCTGSMLVH